MDNEDMILEQLIQFKHYEFDKELLDLYLNIKELIKEYDNIILNDNLSLYLNDNEFDKKNLIKEYNNIIIYLNDNEFDKKVFMSTMNNFIELIIMCTKTRYRENSISKKDTFNDNKINEKQKELLCLTALFHDIVYEPTRNDNEEKSAEFFMGLCEDKNNTDRPIETCRYENWLKDNYKIDFEVESDL